MLATFRTYSLIFRTSIEERLTYRGDFAFATLMRFLPIVTQVILWRAIYRFDQSDAVGELNGYSYPDMVAYYLLAMLGRAFSSMPGLSSGIAREVRDGSVKKYLTQPIDMLGYLFCARAAHKAVYYLVAVAPFALVFYLCRGYFEIQPDARIATAFALSLVMAFLIGFLLEALIGLIAFWFLEVSSLIFIYMMLNYFLSGHMLPIDWLPAPLDTLVMYLPFTYLAYVPAAILLGKIGPHQFNETLAAGGLWIVVLLIANRVAYARGVRRYGAFGG